MSRTLIDLTGQRFGSLVALRRQGSDSVAYAMWLCLCDCGAQHVARGANLRAGNVRRCRRCYRLNVAPPVEHTFHIAAYYHDMGADGGFAVARDGDGAVVSLTAWSRQRQPLAAPLHSHRIVKWTLAELAEKQLIRPVGVNESAPRYFHACGVKVEVRPLESWDAMRAGWFASGGDEAGLHPLAERRGWHGL